MSPPLVSCKVTSFDLTVPFGTFDVAKMTAKSTYEETGALAGPQVVTIPNAKFSVTESITWHAS